MTQTRNNTRMVDDSQGYFPKAYCNISFNGTSAPTLNDSLNVSSVTRDAVGTYTVNFTNSMTNNDYSAFVSVIEETGVQVRLEKITAQYAGYVTFTIHDGTGNTDLAEGANVMIWRTS